MEPCQAGGYFFAGGIWIVSVIRLSNRDLRNRAAEKGIRIKAEKVNRKMGTRAKNSVYKTFTLAPNEYEKMPKAMGGILNKEFNLSHDTCPVPSAADGVDSSTPKDKKGRCRC